MSNKLQAIRRETDTDDSDETVGIPYAHESSFSQSQLGSDRTLLSALLGSQQEPFRGLPYMTSESAQKGGGRKITKCVYEQYLNFEDRGEGSKN